MTIEITLAGTAHVNAAKCVFVPSDSPDIAEVAAGTLTESLTFGSALTSDGPYLYCSTLSAANAAVTIAVVATEEMGNDVEDLDPVTLTVYSEPGAPIIDR